MSKKSRRGPKVGAQHAAPLRTHPISRRKFVGDAVAAGVSFTIVPAHVLGGRGRLAPSDKLNIACIGVGGMGANDVRGVGKTENIYACATWTTARRHSRSAHSRWRSGSRISG